MYMHKYIHTYLTLETGKQFDKKIFGFFLGGGRCRSAEDLLRSRVRTPARVTYKP
jgi:hypothetical protein